MSIIFCVIKNETYYSGIPKLLLTVLWIIWILAHIWIEMLEHDKSDLVGGIAVLDNPAREQWQDVSLASVNRRYQVRLGYCSSSCSGGKMDASVAQFKQNSLYIKTDKEKYNKTQQAYNRKRRVTVEYLYPWRLYIRLTWCAKIASDILLYTEFLQINNEYNVIIRVICRTWKNIYKYFVPLFTDRYFPDEYTI